MKLWQARTEENIKTSYIQLQGGIDLVSPALQIRPGVCIDAGNFVPEISGGYKRVGGYERFDGQPSPSDAVYHLLTVDDSSGIAVGNTLTGSISNVTSVVVAVESATVVVVTKKTGNYFVVDVGYGVDDLEVGGSPVAAILAQAQGASQDTLLDLQYTNLAADEYRGDIQAVPGEGPLRGVWGYDGKLYAFRDNVGQTEAKMYLATTGGWSVVATPTLNPGGTYAFANHNFSGASTGQKMYGCDGRNKAFEFDGTTYTQISTTASPDTPSHIAAHQNRLFLSILGSLFVSSPGDPTSGWAGVGTTPAEIGTGDLITGLLPLPGDSNTAAMAVYGRNKTSILYGSSTSSWNMKVVSPDAGALPRSVQYVSVGLGLDDRGVTALPATDAFGNFAAASVSRAVQPFVDLRRGITTCSSVLRSQNQYRLYFSDGSGLVFRVENGQVMGIMPIFYEHQVSCIVSGEDIGGEEVIFFGSDNGMVYQADVGTSFDGADIEAWIRLGYNAERSPTTRKRWRRAVLEMTVPTYAKLYMTFELDYGDFGIPIAATQLEDFAQTSDTPGAGGFWDQFTWDEFTWDSPFISPPRYDLNGTSQNISLLFFSKDAYSEPFTLQSLIMHFSPRRLQR